MRNAGRILGCLAALLALSPDAQGYYHFVRYLSRTAPWNPIYERFDLNALPNKTVPFLISEQVPTLPAGDSYGGLVSQIRLAAKAWNDVTASDLRIGFGGFFPAGTKHATPAIEVVFDELPPGVYAKGGPTIKADPYDGGNGLFIPILKSTMILPAAAERASWTESAFLTIVHEFGHCLGLQHTLTSSVMSTSVTRATTKATPIGPDDVAGLATLYPVAGAFSFTGSITGRVTLNNSGVNMASVVALSLDGAAISALTQPDGTYRINGVPAGTYYLYVHPLPPLVAGESFDAGITPPRDFDGRFLNASTAFETQFFPGTRDANRAQALVVDAGAVLDSHNFAVARRTSSAVFGVQTYSFPAQIAVSPAHLAVSGARSFILAAGYGLNSRAAVNVIGGSATIPNSGVKPYSLDARFVQLDLEFNLASGQGVRHLTFTQDNYLYVLPAAFRLTRNNPPLVQSAVATVDANGVRAITVVGTNFTDATQILFNGVPAEIRAFDKSTGAMTVVPPPGVAGEPARVVALNVDRTDGQSSMFVQNPPVYDFEAAEAPGFSVNPGSLPLGAETVVEVLATNGNFHQAYSSIAFGASGVHVRRAWVTGPNRMLVAVQVSANAATGLFNVSLLNGLRIQTLPAGVQITLTPPRLSMVRGQIADSATGRIEIPAGATAQARLTGALADVPGVQVTVGDRAAAVVSNQGGLLTFRVPAGLTPGPALVRIALGSDVALPSVLVVDQPAPVVNFASISGQRVDAQRPARPGELVTLNVSGMAEAGATVSASHMKVAVGFVQHDAVAVTPANGSSAHNVQFVLDAGLATGNYVAGVIVDGRVSAPVAFPVRAN